MTIIPPLQYSQKYFRSYLVSMKCSHPCKAIQRSWKGLEITREELFCVIFHSILARNKSWTILNDHYTTSTVLLDVFQITFGVYEVFPTLPKLYRGLGRAWKSLARSYFELFHTILARNKSWTILNDHYTTSTVLLDVFQITFGVYEVFPTLPKLYRGLGRAWKSPATGYFDLFPSYFSHEFK